MRALLLVPNSGLVAEDLLGMPIGLRAVFAAIDAGAVAVEYDATHAAIFGTWAKDERVTRPLIAHATAHPSPSLSPSPNPTPNPTPNPIPTPTPTPTPTPESAREERLVLRTDAVVSPALLTELTLGNALHDASGVPLAARLLLSTTADAAAALAAAPAQAFVVDRYRYAILLASARDRRRAERAMLASLVKPSDGPVSRHINRPISTTVTRMLVPFGVSPNQMTWVTLLVALTGAWYAAHSSFRMQALGAVLFQLSSILDGCDGEIARLTRRSSAHGALLDSLVDDVSNLVFFSALSWGVAHDLAHDSARWPAFAGTATALCYVGVITVQYAFVLRATGHGDKTSFWTPEPGAQHSPLMAFFHGFLRRNVFVAVIMLAVLADCSSWVVAALPFATLGTLSASVRRALAT